MQQAPLWYAFPFLNAPNTCPMQSLYADPHNGALHPSSHPSIRPSFVSIQSMPGISRGYATCLPFLPVV